VILFHAGISGLEKRPVYIWIDRVFVLSMNVLLLKLGFIFMLLSYISNFDCT